MLRELEKVRDSQELVSPYKKEIPVRHNQILEKKRGLCLTSLPGVLFFLYADSLAMSVLFYKLETFFLHASTVYICKKLYVLALRKNRSWFISNSIKNSGTPMRFTVLVRQAFQNNEKCLRVHLSV